MNTKKLIVFITAAVLLFAAGALCIFTGAAEYPQVVYLSDSGSDANEGTADTAPLATLAAAYTKLGGSGTVVLCGDYTVNTGEKAAFPSSDGSVTLTCVYNSVNYYQKNGATLNLKQSVHIGSDMVFESIRIDQSEGTAFFCCGNNVKFGYGITTLASVAPPSIYGGYDLSAATFTGDRNTAKIYGYTIEVCSGVWNVFNGGHLRTGESDMMGTVGDVNIIINGGTFKANGNSATDTAVFSGASNSALLGDLHITVNGGDIYSSLFCLGRAGMNDTQRIAGMEGDVYLTVNAGTIRGTDIRLSQNPTNFLCGDYYLEINGGSFPALSTIDGKTSDNTAYQYVPSSLESKLVGFGKNVFISYTNGNDNVAGTGTASAPVKTIWKAFSRLGGKGGRIIFMDEVYTGGGSVPATDGKVIITTKLGSYDYSDTGALKLGGNLKVQSDLLIENFKLATTKEATLYTNGHSLTLGSECSVYNTSTKTLSGGDITTDGILNIDGGSSTEKHLIKVRSGSYNNIYAGTSSRGTAIVVEGGQINGSLYGASGTMTDGTATVRIDGGVVCGNIYASQMGSKTGVGICVRGGAIRSAGFYAAESGTAKLFSVGIYGGKFETTPAMDRTGAADVSVDSTVSCRKYVNSLGSQDNIIFATNKGVSNATGQNPASPREFVKATTYVTSTGGKVVVIDDVKFDNSDVLDARGLMTLTSFGGGCDWAVTDDVRIMLGAGIELSADTLIDHIDIYPIENNTFISSNGNSLEIGEYVCTEASFSRGVEKGLSIYGGARIGLPGTTGTVGGEIVIRGGNYHKLIGGNIRLNPLDETLRTMTGDINITIYGGIFDEYVSLTGQNNYEGNATLSVYGGKFECPVFGISAAYSYPTGHTVTNTADITLNIAGGTFCGNIDAYEDTSAILNGSYTVNLYDGAELQRVSSIKGTEGLGGEHSSEINYETELSINDSIDTTISFQNPIDGHPDPSVVLGDDGYYYYSYAATSNGKQAIFMTRSPNLPDIDHSYKRLIWTAGDNGDGEEILSIWAPQLYKFDGRWYMYASCSTSDNDHALRQTYIWIGGEHPSDEFTYYGIISGSDSSRSYSSPRFVEWAGVRYLMCGSSYSIIITAMSSPTSLKGSAVVIATPSESFEAAPTTSTKIMEGPVPLISADGVLYVPYAAGHTRGDEYCTGLLKFTGSKTDPLTNASKWQKFSEPMHFASYENRIYSPGAMVFVSSPDGTQTWCVYHAKQYTYTAYTMRRLYLQPLEWVNGVPTVKEPQSADTIFSIDANSLSVASRIGGFDRSIELLPIMGDIDGDRDIDNTDITIAIRHLCGWDIAPYTVEGADMNSDGKFGNRDVIGMIKAANNA